MTYPTGIQSLRLERVLRQSKTKAKIGRNNTPQAYLPVRWHDAQTGGLIFCAAALHRSGV